MTSYIICRSHDPQWLAERRKRVTASELNIWIGTAPSFMLKDDSRELMIQRKLTGEDKPFTDRTIRKMAHGREREASALLMAGELFGYPTAPYSYLIGNIRWPYLAATLDGLMFPWLGRQPRYELTSQMGHMAEIRSTLEDLGQPILTEIKVSDAGHKYKDKDGPNAGRYPWKDFMPTYYLEQVQTGLWMSGLEHALLVGCLGGDELICWYQKRQDVWAGVLDRANEEASLALRDLWAP